MKIIRDKDGLYKFDYKPEGLFYFEPTHVKVLSRKTGKTVVVSMKKIKKGIPAKKVETLISELMMDNEYMDSEFHAIGVKKA